LSGDVQPAPQQTSLRGLGDHVLEVSDHVLEVSDLVLEVMDHELGHWAI
jgi:hypothetical protein